MLDDAKREYRVAEHQEGYVVQVGSSACRGAGWTDCPERREGCASMHRLAGPGQGVDGDDDHSF